MQYSLPSFTFTVSSCFSTLEGSTSCEEHHMHIVPFTMVWHNRLGNDSDYIWRLKFLLLLPAYLIPSFFFFFFYYTTVLKCCIFPSQTRKAAITLASSHPWGVLWNEIKFTVIFFFLWLFWYTPLHTWSSYPPSGAAQQELLSLAE